MTEQTREKQRGKQHLEEAEDNDLENGLITKEDFVKLFKFIKDTPVIQDKIVQINGEDLLTMFNASVLDLTEEENELVEDRKLTFLFYVIRNSIILNLTDEMKKMLQPLSNLALSLEMLDGFLSLLERNVKLKEILSCDVDTDNYNYFCQLVENCKENRETFVQDTFQAERMIILYHTLRNKVLTVVIAQLNLFMANIQNVILRTAEESTDQMKIIMSLPWNQQVIAFEAINFNLPFLERFQAFLLMSLVNQMKTKVDPIKQISPSKQQPSYYKSTKVHQCNFCDYSTKKLSNIKTHLKGKHRRIELKPGENGFTTMNEDGSVAVDYVPRKRQKNGEKAGGEPAVSRRVSYNGGRVRFHQCNHCSYLSVKMSNIKTHLRGKHKDIAPDIAGGFTTLFKAGSLQFSSEDLEEKPGDAETTFEEEEEEEFGSVEDGAGPSVEDFLECNISDDGDQLDADLDLSGSDLSQRQFYKENEKCFRYEFLDFCHICDQHFSERSDWTSHMFNHLEARPFECPIVGCDKAFSRKDVLKGHVRSHSKDKAFPCTFPGCDKAFTRNWYMNVHIETAHFGHRKEEKSSSRAEKIYFCEFCEVSTDSLGKMYGHLHFAHKDFGVLGYKEGYSIKYKNQNGKDGVSVWLLCLFFQVILSRRRQRWEVLDFTPATSVTISLTKCQTSSNTYEAFTSK